MKDAVYRARRRGNARAVPERLLPAAIASPLSPVTDLAKEQLLKTRESVKTYWRRTADILDAQGEIELAGDVRYFAQRLTPKFVDKEETVARGAHHAGSEARRTDDDAHPRGHALVC